MHSSMDIVVIDVLCVHLLIDDLLVNSSVGPVHAARVRTKNLPVPAHHQQTILKEDRLC